MSEANLGGRARKENADPPRMLKCFGGCRFERHKIRMRNRRHVARDEIPKRWLDRPNEITEVVHIIIKKP
jgi:hypothetical protein